MSSVNVDLSLCLGKSVCSPCLAAERCFYGNVTNSSQTGKAVIADSKVCQRCLEKYNNHCSAQIGCVAAKAAVAQNRHVDSTASALSVM